MERQEIEPRTILLRSPEQVLLVQQLVENLPLDDETPIEVTIQEQKKPRKMTLNQAYWAGPLRDIEKTAWYRGHQFSAEVWHEQFKALFLPDENDADFDPKDVCKGYHKWTTSPFTDERTLTGSTTQLTSQGMRKFIQEVEAEGAKHGAVFTEWRDE
ncbi:MAG: recombination protein NinB [Acidobacteriota bacterium]|nr:recombination protein NinB [Acidobacteriota bacterium]